MTQYLILIPGVLCDEALWQCQIGHLSNDYKINVPVLTEDNTIAAMAARVLANAPPRFSLGGLSMGGYVAFEIMRQAPERVEKLILIDTSARADTIEIKRRRRGLAALAKKGDFKGVTPRLLPQLLHPAHLADKEITQTIMDMAARVGRDAYINQQAAIMNRIDSRPFLPKILCPTLVIVGRKDNLTPVEIAEETASLIPDVTLKIAEKSGHLSPLEEPALVSAWMKEFLGG